MAPTMPASGINQYTSSELKDFETRSRAIRSGIMSDDYNRSFPVRSVMAIAIPIMDGVMRSDARSLVDIDVSPGAQGVMFKQQLQTFSTIGVTLAAIIKSGDRYVHDRPLMKLRPGRVPPPADCYERRPVPPGIVDSAGTNTRGGGEDGASTEVQYLGPSQGIRRVPSAQSAPRRRRNLDMAGLEQSFSAATSSASGYGLGEAATVMGRPHAMPLATGESASIPLNNAAVKINASSLLEGIEDTDIPPLTVLIEYTYGRLVCSSTDASVADIANLPEVVCTAETAELSPESIKASIQEAASYLNFSVDDDEDLTEAIESVTKRNQVETEQYRLRQEEARKRGRDEQEAASGLGETESEPLRRGTLAEIRDDVESMLADIQAIGAMLETLGSSGASVRVAKLDLIGCTRRLLQKKECIDQLIREETATNSNGDLEEDLCSPHLRGKIPFSGCVGEVLTGVRLWLLNATTMEFSSIVADIVESADLENINSDQAPIASNVRDNLAHAYVETIIERRQAAIEERRRQAEDGCDQGHRGDYAADAVADASSSTQSSGQKRSKGGPSVSKRKKSGKGHASTENRNGLTTSMSYASNSLVYTRAATSGLEAYYVNEANIAKHIRGGILDPVQVYSPLNALAWTKQCHPLQSFDAYHRTGGRTYFPYGGENSVCSDGFYYFALPTCSGGRLLAADIQNNQLAELNLPARAKLQAPGIILDNPEFFPSSCLDSLGIAHTHRRRNVANSSRQGPADDSASSDGSVRSETSSANARSDADKDRLSEWAIKRQHLQARGIDASALFNDGDAMLNAAEHAGTPFDPSATPTARFAAPDGRESPALQHCSAAATCSDMAEELLAKLPSPVDRAIPAAKMGLRRWAADQVTETIVPTENRNSPSQRCVAKALTSGVLAGVTPPVMARFTDSLPTACDLVVRKVNDAYNLHCVAMAYEAVCVHTCTHTASAVHGNSVRNNVSLVGPNSGGKSTIVKLIINFKLPVYVASDGKVCTTIRYMREWSPTALTAGPNENDRRTTVLEEFRVTKETVDAIKNAMSSDRLSRDVTFTDDQGNRHVITYEAMARSVWITTCNATSLCIRGNTGAEDEAALLSRTPRMFISARPASAVNQMLRLRLQGRMNEFNRAVKSSITREQFSDAFMMLYADLVAAKTCPPPCEDMAMIILAGVSHTLYRNGHPGIEPRFFGFIIAMATIFALDGVYYREWNLATGRFANQPLTIDRIALATEQGVVVGVECIVMAIGFYSTVISNMGHGAICAALLASYTRRAEESDIEPVPAPEEALSVPASARSLTGDGATDSEGHLRMDARLSAAETRSAGVPNAPMRGFAASALSQGAPSRPSANGALYRAAQERAGRATSGLAAHVHNQRQEELLAQELPFGHDDEIIDPSLVDFIVSSTPRKRGASAITERHGVTRRDLMAAHDIGYMIVIISDESCVQLEKDVMKLGQAVSKNMVAREGGEHGEGDDDDELSFDGPSAAPGTSASTAGFHPGLFFGLQGLPRFFDSDRYPPRQACRAMLEKLASGEVGQIKCRSYMIGASVAAPFVENKRRRPTSKPAAYRIPSFNREEVRMAVHMDFMLYSTDGIDNMARATQETLCCSAVRPQIVPFTPGPIGTMRLLPVGSGYGPGATSEADYEPPRAAGDRRPKTRTMIMSSRPYVVPNVFLDVPPSKVADTQARSRSESANLGHLDAAGIAREVENDERRMEEGGRRIIDMYTQNMPDHGDESEAAALNSAIDRMCIGGGGSHAPSAARRLAGSSLRRSASANSAALARGFEPDSEDSLSESSMSEIQPDFDECSQADSELSMSGAAASTALTEHERRIRKAMRAKSKVVQYQTASGKKRKIAVIPDFEAFSAQLCCTKISASAEPVTEADMKIAERYSSRWFRGEVGKEQAVFDGRLSISRADRRKSVREMGAVGHYVSSATACLYDHDPRGAGLPMVDVAKARAAGLLASTDTPHEAKLRAAGYFPDTVPIWAVAAPDGTLSSYLKIHGRPEVDRLWLPVCLVTQKPVHTNYPHDLLENEARCVREMRKIRTAERREARAQAMDVDEGDEYFENDYSQAAEDMMEDRASVVGGADFVNMTDLFAAPHLDDRSPESGTFVEPDDAWGSVGNAILDDIDADADYDMESLDDEFEHGESDMDEESEDESEESSLSAGGNLPPSSSAHRRPAAAAPVSFAGVLSAQRQA